MATGLRFATERSGEGAGEPVLDYGEELMHVQPSVSIVLGNRSPETPGTLYITTKQIVWLSDTDRAKGYAVDFISVTLHAVSRDTEAYALPCLYTQIDTGDEDEELEESDSESDEPLNLSKVTEMRLVPSDPNQLDTLFAIFCECAELNPDPIAAEDEVEHNWTFSVDHLEDNGGEVEDPEWPDSQNTTLTIGANGNHDLAHSVVQLQLNDERFEDAEEMDQDDKNGHQ